MFTGIQEDWSYAAKRSGIFGVLRNFNIRTHVLTLDDGIKTLTLAFADEVAAGRISSREWREFICQLAWNPERPNLEAQASILGERQLAEGQKALVKALEDSLTPQKTYIKQVLVRLNSLRGGNILVTGANWMDSKQLAASPIYHSKPTPASLLIGYHESGEPVYFSGDESLITLGGPGSGKSQVHVIPNLLRYPGSAVVLDVKGEIWDATAGYRQTHFGDVYRFSPSDRKGLTHAFNVFDYISKEPGQAAADCTLLSHQIILENPKLTDPFWENRARDMLWAFATFIAIKGTGAKRSMLGLSELINLPMVKDKKAPIHAVLASMIRNGERHKIGDLVAAANAIKAGLEGTRNDSIMDAARRHLSVYTRTPSIVSAITSSHWAPDVLRLKKGTTVYICMSPSELTSYGAIVRMMLMQHMQELMQHRAKPGEPPVTFFLDEMPQLGNFDSILQAQDVGRGAGIRLWMFAQYMGQLNTAFGSDRYKGLIEACRVRCFMRPDQEAARMLEHALGQTSTMLGKEHKPLATGADLMGAKYRDKIIVTTSGDHPMCLDKRYAYKTDADKMIPIVIKKVP